MINRSNDHAFMNAAIELAKDSKCVSKQVGCVIVFDNHIVSSGVNGTPPGYKYNCNDVFDPHSFDRESHHHWSRVHELHAESNAFAGLLKAGSSIKNATMFVTLQPCESCSSMIAASGIVSRVVYYKKYDKGSPASLDFLKERGIIVEQFRN